MERVLILSTKKLRVSFQIRIMKSESRILLTSPFTVE